MKKFYILRMAPEFPVKPRVDSCSSPLQVHQMPPEAVFPPDHGWEVPDFDTLTSSSCVVAIFNSKTAKILPYLPHLLKLFMGALAWFSSKWLLDRQKRLTLVSFPNLQPNKVSCKCACKTLSKSSTLGS